MLNLILGNNNHIFEEFLTLFNKAYSQLKNKNISEAVGIYNQIYEKFSNLKPKQKTKKLANDIKLLYKEIILYSKLNQAYVHSFDGNLKPLKEELEILHDLAYGTSLEENDFKAIEIEQSNNKFNLEVYTKRLYLKDLETQISKTETLATEKKFNEVLLEYTKAVIIFRKILNNLPQETKTAIYFKIRKLFKNLVIHNITKEKPKSKKSKKAPAESIFGFEDTYQKIQECLKKGDIKTASKLYKHL